MTLSTVRDVHRFDEGALSAYLSRHLEGFSGPLEVLQFDAGQSNPTFLLRTPAARYVLRKKPPGNLLPRAHMVEREYRVMKALRETAVPVPRMLLLCEDAEAIGTAFFIMEYLEGRVFWSLSPANGPGVQQEMLRVLAALHRADVDAVGLGDFGKPGNYFARQISRWTQQYRAAQTDDIDAMERLIECLPARIPDDDATGLVHGDYRIDNLVFHSSEPRILGVLDWELATLGHPLADLAYLCQAYHVETPYQKRLEPGDGILSEAETIALYRRATGRAEIRDWPFYLAFSMFRLAAIAQGVYKRGLDGNASSTRALAMGDLVSIQAEAAWRLVC